MTKLKITYRGYIFYSLIDDEDYSELNKIKWSLKPDGNRLYAQGRINRKVTSLHRFIMNPESGICIDHIDGNGLNNQKSNLRFCTKRQNSMNTPKRSWNTTGFKGVTKHGNKFRASVWDGNKRLYLGLYEKPSDAAAAYNQKVKEIHGGFAYLNDIMNEC